MTYESASEAEVLKSLWRQGAPLENTLFAILDPSGRPIIGAGRSPSWYFRDSSDMAATMNDIARHYSDSGMPDELPAIDSVRLAMNVAACDKRPLAIVVARSSDERQRLSRTLASIAWSDHLVGQLTYTISSGRDLGQVRGANIGSGYIFVAPNLFGTEGTAMVQLNASASPADLERAAQQAIAQYNPQFLNHNEHVRLGQEEGVEWQTAIPETDPHGPGRGMPGRGTPPSGMPPPW